MGRANYAQYSCLIFTVDLGCFSSDYTNFPNLISERDDILNYF